MPDGPEHVPLVRVKPAAQLGKVTVVSELTAIVVPLLAIDAHCTAVATGGAK